MAGVQNPFATDAAADRYLRGRLSYHPAALACADRLLGRTGPVRLAVDVGSGTGLSTRALLGRADHVVAVDPSAAMLRRATRVPGAATVAAAAERLPLADAVADLATAGAAFHWFDPADALAELARVLRPGGALVVYTDAFDGRVDGAPGVRDWFTGTHLPALPVPPRHAYFAPEAAVAAGFDAPRYAEQETDLPLTRTGLVDYLLSQSATTAAVDSGATTVAALRDSTTSALAGHLPDDRVRSVTFRVRVWATTRGTGPPSG